MSCLPEHLGPTEEPMKIPHTIMKHTQPRTPALYSLCHAVTDPSCLPFFLPVSHLNSHSLCCTWLNHRHNSCPSTCCRFWSQPAMFSKSLMLELVWSTQLLFVLPPDKRYDGIFYSNHHYQLLLTQSLSISLFKVKSWCSLYLLALNLQCVASSFN